MKISRLVLCLTVAMIGRAMGQAQASDSSGSSDSGPKLQGYVSAGAGYTGDYEGSDDYKWLPYFEARLNLGNYYARYEGDNLRFNLVDSETFHAGPLLGIRRRRHHVESAAVSAMAEIDYTMTGGGFIEFEHVGQDPRYGERATLFVADDLVGANSGWTVALRADIRRPLKFVDRGLILDLEGDVTWADDRYMNTYFGVSPPDSVAGGLPIYHAGSGIESVGVALSIDQFLSRHWSVGVRLHYGRLLGDAADSPVTAIEGAPNQFFMGFVIGYVIGDISG